MMYYESNTVERVYTLIKTLDKAIAVINVLNTHKELGPTDIGEMLGEDKSTIYRILATLEKHELVKKNNNKKYSLGFGFLKYSANITANSDLVQIAHPYLQELKDKAKESSHICVLTKKNTAVFLDNINQDAVLSINNQIGTEQPLHCSAVAKSIIAFLPEQRLNEIVDSIDFHTYTIHTITTKSKFLEHLDGIRLQGYSTDDEEIYIGVRCVAAPIFDDNGEVIASIGVSGPSTRIQDGKFEFYVNVVKAASYKITQQLQLFNPLK